MAQKKAWQKYKNEAEKRNYFSFAFFIHIFK